MQFEYAKKILVLIYKSIFIVHLQLKYLPTPNYTLQQQIKPLLVLLKNLLRQIIKSTKLKFTIKIIIRSFMLYRDILFQIYIKIVGLGTTDIKLFSNQNKNNRLIQHNRKRSSIKFNFCSFPVSNSNLVQPKISFKVKFIGLYISIILVDKNTIVSELHVPDLTRDIWIFLYFLQPHLHNLLTCQEKCQLNQHLHQLLIRNWSSIYTYNLH
eukprot:TRINITY_DN873_c0_g1_i12.p2 TRINITY_DN873_c0_g1~~TRINITY_DN873_c0_g1_i12.p2  ORF type:complete len:211 (-),score=-26.05 TRINITY_DN873_c0_g1_i12:157-789(-)